MKLISLIKIKCNLSKLIAEALKTIDYVNPGDGFVIFRTCEEEKGKVILQMGTANVERAVQLAKMVEQDVAAIDVNMGCPKEFSVKGGMGVALMANLNLAKEILTALVEAVKIPVTCKIRVLKSTEETIKVVKELESTGIAAIGIHGRTKDERPHHQVNTDIIKAIAAAINIPVIANGGSKEIQKYKHIMTFREASGASSVMLARAIEWNCSILRKEGLLPLQEVIVDYLRIADKVKLR